MYSQPWRDRQVAWCTKMFMIWTFSIFLGISKTHIYIYISLIQGNISRTPLEFHGKKLWFPVDFPKEYFPTKSERAVLREAFYLAKGKWQPNDNTPLAPWNPLAFSDDSSEKFLGDDSPLDLGLSPCFLMKNPPWIIYNQDVIVFVFSNRLTYESASCLEFDSVVPLRCLRSSNRWFFRIPNLVFISRNPQDRHVFPVGYRSCGMFPGFRLSSCEVWTMVDLKMAIYEMEISLGGCGDSAFSELDDVWKICFLLVVM